MYRLSLKARPLCVTLYIKDSPLNTNRIHLLGVKIEMQKITDKQFIYLFIFMHKSLKLIY